MPYTRRNSLGSRRNQHESVTKEEMEEGLNELHNQIKNDLNSIVKSEIEGNLRIYKVALIAFATGFALFLTLGLLTKGQLFESMVKTIYTPENIHKDLMPQLSTDVWNTVTSGTTQDYEKFISRNEFYEALRAYHTDLVKTFLLPTRERTVRANEILQAGKTQLDATILMAGKQYNGRPTARCYKEFLDMDSQAIIVIPKSSDPSEFAWFDCAFGWPKITLALKVGEVEISDIQLVGVRRNGGTENLQILISQTVAKRLNLPGWESYKAHAFGKLYVATVE